MPINFLRTAPIVFLIGVCVIITACSQRSVPIKQAPILDHDLVAAIRSAGNDNNSAVQVQPLRDPAVDGFLKQAYAAEALKNYDEAVANAKQALKLTPEAPEVLQYLAELEIARGNYQPAEQLALQSFNLGPKVGSLCARNWQTVVEVSLALNDINRKTEAQQQVKECHVSTPVRM